MKRSFVDQICTGYPLLMRAQALSYRDELNAVLVKKQSHGKYLGGYPTQLGDDGHFFHVVEVECEKQRRSITACLQGDRGFAEVLPQAGPSLVTAYFSSFSKLLRLNCRYIMPSSFWSCVVGWSA